jgi:uncharacterized protein (DUF427 family)
MLADMARPRRIEPGPGQESVWDYPRPPRVEPTDSHVTVWFGGRMIADTHRAVRVLETSQAPGIYIPLDDVADGVLVPSERRSMCEWKGRASYWSVQVGDAFAVDAAWSYPEPTPAFAGIAGHVSFYPQRMDSCWVDDERVEANEGDFYGGWVTSKVVGPFKGGAGSWGW